MKEVKEKKCGNPNCQNEFKQFNSLQKYCSASCKMICEVNKLAKKVKPLTKEDIFKYDYRNIKVSDLLIRAKKELQRWVKIRDRSEGCISCDKKNSIEWHGGHCFKAEIYSGVELADINVHMQCPHCNIDLQGNFEGFKNGLIKRYGNKFFDELEELANETRKKKWDAHELREITSKYRKLNNEAKFK